jgi:hypothetical protein
MLGAQRLEIILQALENCGPRPSARWDLRVDPHILLTESLPRGPFLAKMTSRIILATSEPRRSIVRSPIISAIARSSIVA